MNTENVFEVVTKIRDYINKNEWCYGSQWLDITVDMNDTLTSWRMKHPNDYTEEWEWIHRAATHNWHRYEDPEY